MAEVLGKGQQPVDNRRQPQPTTLSEKGDKGRIATFAGIATTGIVAGAIGYLLARGKGGDPNQQAIIPQTTPTTETPGLVMKASPTPPDMPTVTFNPSPTPTTEAPTQEPIVEEGRIHLSNGYSIIPPEGWVQDRGENEYGDTVDRFIDRDRGAVMSIVPLELKEGDSLETLKEIYKTKISDLTSEKYEPYDYAKNGPVVIDGHEAFHYGVEVSEDNIFINYAGFVAQDKFWFIQLDNPHDEQRDTSNQYFIQSLQTIKLDQE